MKDVLFNELLGNVNMASWVYVRLAEDFSTSILTATDVPGMEFTPEASAQYEVEGFFILRSAATTTGPQPGIVWPTNVGDGAATIQVGTSASATSSAHGGTGAAVKSAADAVVATTSSMPGRLIASFFTASNVSGTFKVTLESEIDTSQVTMKAGSFIRYRRIA